jgi:hypothetical protein
MVHPARPARRVGCFPRRPGVFFFGYAVANSLPANRSAATDAETAPNSLRCSRFTTVSRRELSTTSPSSTPDPPKVISEIAVSASSDKISAEG